ncbi:Oxo-4-hydroxy-4-carboxy-5-ureidoimidazoline decarboxylase [Pyronema domesticum]|uniref:Similar to Probable allantoinase 1 acc. no. Q54SV3 n=1 Tax=Pyronema omphalodes (strain CBS 100304) TaxID=1076935 RepID=U4LHB3_PYROM|nr:Oxo-4-hydroxy-4-carboxy-5-ureidoimidazoline decarboxylase [Pyronema domesticum]CCX30912.1 Similar to Probable allantoinase 1; acc. no. Q54SV3 [Pyronema omphalodes CBS 100304]
MALPPISALSSSPEHLQPILDSLFEPSPALHTLVACHLPRSFDSYDSFADFVASLLFDLTSEVSEGKQQQLLEILSAHPRLGAKKTEVLSEHSAKEQASLQAASEEEVRRLGELNKEYEEKFPGLRYVVFVNGKSREVVMENMKERIKRGDLEEEKREAIEAMRDIAKDRASKLIQ